MNKVGPALVALLLTGSSLAAPSPPARAPSIPRPYVPPPRPSSPPKAPPPAPTPKPAPTPAPAPKSAPSPAPAAPSPAPSAFPSWMPLWLLIILGQQHNDEEAKPKKESPENGAW